MSEWQEYASPVWMDIKPGDTLQKESAREDEDERHICPLQKEVVRRAMRMWSRPGDFVLSPFAGIGTEGFISIEQNRKFVGIELKGSYFEQACANLKIAEGEAGQVNMFEELMGEAAIVPDYDAPLQEDFEQNKREAQIVEHQREIDVLSVKMEDQ